MWRREKSVKREIHTYQPAIWRRRARPGQATLFSRRPSFGTLPTTVLLYRPLRRKKISSSSRLPYVRISQYLSPSEVVRHTAPEKNTLFNSPVPIKIAPGSPHFSAVGIYFFLAHPPPFSSHSTLSSGSGKGNGGKTKGKLQVLSTLPSSKKKRPGFYSHVIEAHIVVHKGKKLQTQIGSYRKLDEAFHH